MPEGAVYVGRPTRWGNPFVVGTGQVSATGSMDGPGAGRYDSEDVRSYDLPLHDGLTAAEVVALYRFDLLATIDDGDPYYDDLREALDALRGHDLVCWCPLDQPCHADVLLDMANA
jgi:hypothetical protein